MNSSILSINNNDCLYAGIDLHKNYSFVTIMDNNGYIQYQGRHNNRDNSLTPFLLKYQLRSAKKIRATVESTYGWYWLADSLDQANIDINLAHPAKVNAIAGKKKTDNHDSSILADLLRTNYLPCSYIPTMQERQNKELFRFRMLLVNQRSTLKRRLRDILAKQNIECKHSNILGKKAQDWLNSLNCPYPYQDEINSALILAEQMTIQIKDFDQKFKDLIKKDPNAQLLQSIPGIGSVLALVLTAEIGDINRFKNDRALSSYAGLVPSVHSSGDKTYLGRTGKRGNKYMRWALAEGVSTYIKKDPSTKELYQRLSLKKQSKAKARVAAMNKMLRVIYYVLKYQKTYQVRPVNRSINTATGQLSN